MVQSVIQPKYFFSIDKVPFWNTLRIISRKRRKHLLYKDLEIEYVLECLTDQYGINSDLGV